jgi:hypothetical protein
MVALVAVISTFPQVTGQMCPRGRPAEPALYDPHLREVDVDQRGAGEIEAIPDQ